MCCRWMAVLVVLAGMSVAGRAATPTFYARQDYIGLFSQSVAVADTNGDGIPDLLATDGGFLQVLFGNGDGTFRTGPSEVTIAGADIEMVALDLNGDGRVDLVMAGGGNHLTGGFVVCFGNGDGTFQPGTAYSVGAGEPIIGYLALGDFDGDGRIDVAQAATSGVWLFRGKGDGTFQPAFVAASLAPGSSGIATADFNGDGNPDLVVTIGFAGDGTQGDGFYLLFGNGDGTFQTPQHFPQQGRPNVAVAGKLGPGGAPGFLVSFIDEPYVAVYFGDGTGGFARPRHVEMPVANNALAIGDINGDGIPDLVSTAIGAPVYVALGTAVNTFRTPVEYPIQSGLNVYNLALADLRRNGRLDIVTDAQAGVSVLLNQGKGRFEDGLFTKLNAAAGCGVTADFDRDGKPDVAVNTSQGISVLLGTGKASRLLGAENDIALPNAGCLTETGDLNGDGIPDLTITSNVGVVSYLGNGDGTFTLKSTTPTAIASPFMRLADFNHDGKLDFVTAGNLMAYGNGDGTFQTPVAFVSNPPVGGFDNIAVGDINNDGWPDVVLTNQDLPYANLYVLLDNHHGGFVQVPQSFGAGTTGAILADLNGDGNLDLVCTNDVYLGYGKGDFTFILHVGFNGAGGTIDMVADLNGDGIPDIGVLGSGTVQIYLGLGDATYAAPFYLGTGPAPGTIFTANLHGQAAAGGLPDLVAPDESGGIMVLLNTTK